MRRRRYSAEFTISISLVDGMDGGGEEATILQVIIITVMSDWYAKIAV